MYEFTPSGLKAASDVVTVREVSPDALAGGEIAAWERLGERALEPNAYLTPMFVLPALAYLDAAPTPVSVFLIEAAGGELIGVGVFNTKPLLPFFGWQSLVGFRSRHSYLTGLLVDALHAASAVDAFFAFVSRPGTRWHGVRFDWLSVGSSGRLLHETARKRNIWWSEAERMRRAILLPRGNDASLIGRISVHLLKDLRRRQRRLSETGKMEWRIHSGIDVSDVVIERFLSLEHMGWKGAGGTSLRSNAAHERFFKAMITGFRDAGRVFFTELLHDGRVIASTCNLVSGNSGFAFKIGWDSAYASYSPGILNELELLQRAREKIGHLELIDSGAVAGSFIDKLWCDRRDLVSGVFATTWAGKLLFAMAAARRRLRLAVATLSLSSPADSAPASVAEVR